ncbi:hypothetical protein FOL47_009039 [Perkinsus chesapeaki]|uniref:Uncharacterized protein n=1 Tax=Perkinsus chesapeaki TaxID=330153 RepID=A0A7J6LAT1_PERCH|nr:hypothetical protein FOL47_009039 [Perkinsus chesapeaki]
MANLGVTAIREATKSDYKLARLTVVYTATIREHLTNTITNLKLGLKAIDNGVDPVWPMPARQERRAWRVTYNKGPHHHGKYAVKHYVFHDWRYKFTFYNVADPRPVISTVLGSLSGDAAVTCDFAWYFPGTEEYLSETRKTEEAQNDTKELLFQGYEHYLKANYVDLEHRKTCKADGRWSSLRRDTGSVSVLMVQSEIDIMEDILVHRHSYRRRQSSCSSVPEDTGGVITEQPAPYSRITAHHSHMPGQEIIYLYEPEKPKERPLRRSVESEEIDTTSLVRPSTCDPSLGEVYSSSITSRIEEDAAAIDNRIEELQAELGRLSRTSSDCTALADELSELVNQWRTRSQENPTVSSDTVQSTSSALADIDSANRQLEHILGIRPDTPIHHIEDLHKKVMKLLRKTLYLEKQMCLGSEGRSAVGSPEILRASEAISGVIESLLSKNAPERQGTTEEIVRLAKKYGSLSPVLDGLIGTCESIQARKGYLYNLRRFQADLQSVSARVKRLESTLVNTP